METKLDHHKFYVEKNFNQLQIGDYLPNETIHLNNPKVKAHDLIKDHLLLIFYSTDCDACLSSMESLEIFIKKYPGINLSVFLHAETDHLNYFKEVFHKYDKNIFSVSKNMIFKKFHTYGLPRGYSVNCKGQILATNNISDIFWFEELLKPLNKLLNLNERR
ncbi:TlpA family protein disulfide reductase [Paenibacillus chitinolyticus]